MSGKVRQLSNKAFIQVTCPNCECSDVYDREGISPGFSYLEDIKGEEYECTFCQKQMIIGDDPLFGWVRN